MRMTVNPSANVYACADDVLAHTVGVVAWYEYVERVGTGMSQAAIGERLGVTQGTVNRWRHSEPKPATVRAFARAFNRPVLEAFVAAGFLSEEEADLREIPVDLLHLDDDDLIREVRRRMTRYSSPAEEFEHVPEEATKPEKAPVVAAIVTCERGVLVGKRNDGKPPWTFIAGEVEPGESLVDAAIREVKEETGLRVVAAEREIARRVHPKTGRTMIYLACSPTGSTDVFVGDQDELAEVKWASLPEAEELLPGLFEPVHQYLVEQLET